MNFLEEKLELSMIITTNHLHNEELFDKWFNVRGTFSVYDIKDTCIRISSCMFPILSRLIPVPKLGGVYKSGPPGTQAHIAGYK